MDEKTKNQLVTELETSAIKALLQFMWEKFKGLFTKKKEEESDGNSEGKSA